MLRVVARILLPAVALVALVAGCGYGTRAERGAALFRTCVPCHGADGAGNLALRTPAIAGLPSWYIQHQLVKFQHDIRGAHPDDMDGHRMRPMARTLYHRGDIEAVAAYVSKLPAVPAPVTYAGARPDSGQVRYTTVCIACHGPDGKGNEAVGSPKLVGQWDWYLMAQLRKFQSGMRGAHPDDTTGAQMRAMALTIPDSVAMHDVIAYIKTLPAR